MKSKINIIVVAFLAICTSCITQEKCWERFPPQINDSTNYRESVKDSAIHINGDSSWAQYLVECQEGKEGYKAVLTQILNQKPGEYLTIPVATMNNNILTTRASVPEREVHVLIKTIHFSAVKSQVYVRITNVLTWWQKWLMYIGAATIACAIAFAIFFFVKTKLKLWL